MNKKGFTLIELLAVIVVIALIIIIVAPNVTKVISGSKKDSQKVQLSTVEDALKTYITQNALALGDTDSVCISDLKETGLLEDKVIYNTDTNEEITGCYNITWNSEYNQYDYEYNKDAVKVTFNANGGVVNIPSKTVTIGQTYGDLPTPTREGYTFKGWNGKNLFDENEILMAIDGATYTDGHYVFTYGNAHVKYGETTSGIIPIGGFKENTQYVLTINGYVEYISETHPPLIFYMYYTDGTYSRISLSSLTEKEFILKSTANKTVKKIFMSYGSGKRRNAYISSIQLEEGSFATPYEPYYVTSLTNVTQAKNHTLTAIWEQNT